jgi:hypothetical protein
LNSSVAYGFQYGVVDLCLDLAFRCLYRRNI